MRRASKKPANARVNPDPPPLLFVTSVSSPPSRRIDQGRRGLQTPIAVPKKGDLGGAWNAKVKRMAYRAVNAPTSTHFTCFLNNYECFSAGGCGQPSESAGVSRRMFISIFGSENKTRATSPRPRIRRSETESVFNRSARNISTRREIGAVRTVDSSRLTRRSEVLSLLSPVAYISFH